MVLRRYGPHKDLRSEKSWKISTAVEIIDEYADQGLSLTLRQLYYQFVARGLIPNDDKEYKKLGDAVSDGRYLGRISWRAIEDRTRFLRGNPHWDHPSDILFGAASQFRYDLWESQPERIEVWIEKDALLGVIEQTCRNLDIDFFSCRGYVSASEMWEASQRLGRYLDNGQEVTILHLGDHDPSGIQMTDDIRRRLEEFCEADFGFVPQVERIALTMDQVTEFNPPPNPAKLSDSRAADYVERYGYESWELDALPPDTLQGLIEDAVSSVRDVDAYEQAEARQERARAKLREVAETITVD